MGPPSDEELIRRARGGDRDAFGMLVERHQDRIYNAVLRIVGNTAAAEDVTQKVFVNAFLRIREFTGGSLFTTWLYRIAHNEAISNLRYEGRRRAVSLDRTSSDEEEPSLPEPPDMNADPAAAAERQEDVEMLHRALARLDPEDRSILVLREMEGLSYEEIASAMSIPIGTVRSRLYRAREALRKSLRSFLGTFR
jgi:RNA polymerase sigma-70 factor (ECF subfamily)